MRERRRRYGNLTAIVLAAGLTFGATGPSYGQNADQGTKEDAPIDIAEQARMSVQAIDDGDYDNAVQLLEPLAEQDHLPSIMALGHLYSTETDALNDDEKAFGYFEQAAALGSDLARLAVAVSHELGQGVPENRIKARELYKELANCGMIAGHLSYGNSFLGDATASEDEYLEAEQALRIGAEIGVPYAQTSWTPALT